MFIKTLFSFIVAHILLLGGVNTRVYVAPDADNQHVSTTSKQTIVATTTSQEKNSVTKKDIPKIVKPKTVLPKQATSSNTTANAPIKEPEPDFVAINEFARKATINILCVAKGGELSPISGTGAIVEPNGLILTNAHIGQYFLLKDFRQKDFIQCVGRTGSPAYPKYRLELVYISPTWIGENKDIIKSQSQTSTGENDFAFLRVSGMVDESNVPSVLPFITMNIRGNIEPAEPVLLSSYPAGFLGGISILQDLSLTTAVTNIKDVFTFKDGSIDIVSVGGTVVSQRGSSGGLVVDKNSTLIGVITTSTEGNTTKERELNAITLGYIDRSIQKELGFGLRKFISETPETFAKVFASTTAPTLSKILIDEIQKH